MKSTRRSTWVLASASLVGLASIGGAAWGQTLYWDTNGATAGAGSVPNGTWDSTSPLWSTDSTGASPTDVWVSGSSAVFTAGSNSLTSFNVTLSGAQTASDIVFEEGLTRLSGGSLILTTGVITSIASQFTMRADIQAPIEGTAGLTKNGIGMVILSAANTYTGGTTINGGGIVLGASNVLPDATVLTINSGSLSMGAFSDTVGTLMLSGGGLSSTTGTFTAGSYLVTSGGIGAHLAGAGALTKTGTGTLSLSGANFHSGGTFISGGLVNCTQPGVLPSAGDVTINGGTLNILSPQTCGSFILDGGTLAGSNSLTASATSSFTPSTIELRKGSITGNLDGNAPVLKTTDGIVFMSSANSYTSPTTISAGMLWISNPAALGATGATSGTTIAAGATLRLNPFLSPVSEPLVINGAGVGGLGAIDNFSFSAVILDGPITLGSDATIGNSGSGQLTISGGIDIAGHALTFIDSPSPFRIVTKGITGSGGVVIASNSAVRLFAACTYTGPTTTNGTVFLNTDDVLPDNSSVSINGGNLSLLANDTVANASLISGSISNVNSNVNKTLTVTSSLDLQSGTITAAIAGAATVTKTTSGTVVFSGSNSTYTGATSVNAGTLRFDTGLPTPGGTITVAPSALLAGGGTIGRPVVNNGTVAGPMTPDVFLTLAAPVSGSGVFTGNITIADALSPGSSPAAIVMDNVDFDATAHLILEIGGLEPGYEYDTITFTTGATLGGTLDLELFNGFQPQLGDTFVLLSGTTTGSFSSIILPPLGSNRAWDTSNLYTTGSVTVGLPEPSTAFLAPTAVLGCVRRRRKRPGNRPLHF